MISKVIVPFSVAQAVGSVLVKLVAVSVPPVVPERVAVTDVAPTALKVKALGLAAGGVPFMITKIVVSSVPVLSEASVKLLAKPAAALVLTSYPVGAVTTNAEVKFRASMKSDWLALAMPLHVKKGAVVPKAARVGIAVLEGVVGNQFDGLPNVIICVVFPAPPEPIAKFKVLALLYSKVSRLVPEFPTVFELGVVLLKRPALVPVGACVKMLEVPNVKLL